MSFDAHSNSQSALTLAALLQEQNPEVLFAKFDTSEDELDKLAEQLKIQTLPNFKFYKGGKEVLDQVIGYKKKPLADAVANLKKRA